MTCLTVAACPFARPSSRVTISPTPTVAPLHAELSQLLGFQVNIHTAVYSRFQIRTFLP